MQPYVGSTDSVTSVDDSLVRSYIQRHANSYSASFPVDSFRDVGGVSPLSLVSSVDFPEKGSIHNGGHPFTHKLWCPHPSNSNLRRADNRHIMTKSKQYPKQGLVALRDLSQTQLARFEHEQEIKPLSAIGHVRKSDDRRHRDVTRGMYRHPNSMVDRPRSSLGSPICIRRSKKRSCGGPRRSNKHERRDMRIMTPIWRSNKVDRQSNRESRKPDKQRGSSPYQLGSSQFLYAKKSYRSPRCKGPKTAFPTGSASHAPLDALGYLAAGMRLVFKWLVLLACASLSFMCAALASVISSLILILLITVRFSVTPSRCVCGPARGDSTSEGPTRSTLLHSSSPSSLPDGRRDREAFRTHKGWKVSCWVTRFPLVGLGVNWVVNVCRYVGDVHVWGAGGEVLQTCGIIVEGVRRITQVC
eukprot:GHVN01051631.1.p1 GENE.GHVN01051631.1~~GHVN01051631.1.p1  ORF type:complete len:415 (+),score=31.42 GHVN01051631.1:4022-5266(+)